MSDSTALREAVDALAARSVPPDYDELQRRAARRGRRRVSTVAAGSALAIVAVGGGLNGWVSGGTDNLSSVGDRAAPSSEPLDSLPAFGNALDALLEDVPGWGIEDGPYPDGFDYAFNGPCTGNWSAGSTSGGDGGVAFSTSSDGMGVAGFRTPARASEASARLADNLIACTTTQWQARPIAGTEAVLASSPDAAAWIQPTGNTVVVLQVRTTDGPPPAGVQVDVAEWIVAYRDWQEQNG